jgi:hypothetical protein
MHQCQLTVGLKYIYENIVIKVTKVSKLLK